MENLASAWIIGAAIVLAIVAIFALRGRNGMPSGEPPDPIAEAEVYLAYGRSEQAKQVLQNALSIHPGRKDIAAKLRELEATR